jgi:hypothetical protein
MTIEACEVAGQRRNLSSLIQAFCLHNGERMDERMSDDDWTTWSGRPGSGAAFSGERSARLLAGAEGLRIDAGGYRSEARMMLEAARLARARGEAAAVTEAVQAARRAHRKALKTARFARSCEMRAERLSGFDERPA